MTRFAGLVTTRFEMAVTPCTLIASTADRRKRNSLSGCTSRRRRHTRSAATKLGAEPNHASSHRTHRAQHRNTTRDGSNSQNAEIGSNTNGAEVRCETSRSPSAHESPALAMSMSRSRVANGSTHVFTVKMRACACRHRGKRNTQASENGHRSFSQAGTAAACRKSEQDSAQQHGTSYIKRKERTGTIHSAGSNSKLAFGVAVGSTSPFQITIHSLVCGFSAETLTVWPGLNVLMFSSEHNNRELNKIQTRRPLARINQGHGTKSGKHEQASTVQASPQAAAVKRRHTSRRARPRKGRADTAALTRRRRRW